MANNNELAHRIFNELFDDEDLDNMKAKGIISQPLGYRLSSIAIIECELDDSCYRIADDIAELRGAINEMINYKGILTSDNPAIINAKKLLNK